ncbi:MAG: NUDIX hydrolase [Pseudomonadaceae bacterium]|nr:NUDIX hydrolase [Pseudomonadaceae bacterium]
MSHFVGEVSEHAVIYNADDNILLLRHTWEHLKGKWHLPGGRMDAKDTPGQGLLRELREETGLTGVELIMPCHASRWGAAKPVVKYSIAYLAKVQGTPKVILPPDEDHDLAEWVAVEEALGRTFTFPELADVIRGVHVWAKRLGVVE